MVVMKPYQDTLGVHTESDLVDRFLKSLVPTNRTYDFFVDWNKVNQNIEALKTEIALLGSLSGSTDPDGELHKLLSRYPEVSRAIPILVAVRDLKIQVLEDIETSERFSDYDFSKSPLSPTDIEGIVTFCRKTGLTSLLASAQILRDYAVGVEVGMDTNARKNRSGTAMEHLLNRATDDLAAELPNIEVRTQQKFSVLEKTKGISVPPSLKDRKFDMAIIVGERYYNVETNFYSGTGSKPQEIVDSYINRHVELKQGGWRFIWVTDGHGWSGMTNQVQKAFQEMDYILNVEFISTGTLLAILSHR